MRLGTSELLLIVILAILLFGGTRIAGIGKALGRSIREFKGEIHADNPVESSDKDEQSDENTEA
ncbi:MAG: twin-arginine translocase TatA/TatE family subunit [Eubacterium sp.]|nr:twin-arginine translocase TatA/TatE family subunit [Eubacterium sp.]